jgi:hypothetical protein
MSETEEIFEEVMRVFGIFNGQASLPQVYNQLEEDNSFVLNKENWKEAVRFSIYRNSPHSPLWDKKRDSYRNVKKGVWRQTSHDDDEPDLEKSEGYDEESDSFYKKQGWLVQQSIRKRRGQTSFRNRLLEKYSKRCLITNCSIQDLLEAAHITPYSRSQDNSTQNGLILRSDIHTLFDLNLIGIEPESMLVNIAPSINDSTYRCFDNVDLSNRIGLVNKIGLKQRWDSFRKKK